MNFVGEVLVILRCLPLLPDEYVNLAPDAKEADDCRFLCFPALHCAPVLPRCSRSSVADVVFMDCFAALAKYPACFGS